MAEDPDFVNGGEFEEANPALPKPYELRVRDVGNVAFGVLDIAEDYWDGGAETSINVGVGDWGAMIVGETYVSGSAQSFVVDQDLRVLEAESIGRLTASSSNSTVNFGLGVAPVVGGDVHRLRATGSAGLLSVNDIYIGSPFPPPAIGGNYVEIDGEGQVFGYLYANEGIGALRAGRMTTFAPSKLVVNHDASGFDGIIDLIDVEGDFGSISAGGPQITTNAGGNVRFLRVEGDVYRDALFGGGSSEETNFSVGVAATITDDSGSVVTLQPVGTPNPLYNPADPLSVEPEFIGGLSPQIISLLTYGIRGSGGSAIIDIQTTGSVTISARGSARSARAEIGRIEVRGLGAEVLDIADIETETDTAGNPTTVVPQPDATTGSTLVLDPDGETLEVVINDGGADIDVLNVVVVANDGDGSVLSNLTRLRNNTKGSIASVIAKTIGTIDSDGSVGVVDGHVPGTIRAREELRLTPSFPTPRDPRPNNPGVTTLAYTPGDGEAMSTGGAVFVGDIYPFAGQTTGIVANGNIGSIRSNRAIGNVIANGSIGAIRANADGRDVANLFEGISGPIVAEDYSPARFGLQGSETAGRMFYVDIGEGILSAGTGGTASSGLYAADRISTVVNQGEGSDIRGEVVSRSAIGNITLTNGALINADVLVAGSFDFAREFVEGNAAASPSDPLDAPIYEIEKVLTTGSGGIIGTYISAPDIGDIVSTGFGILSTSIVPVGGAKVVNSVRGSGYGIRAVTIEGGASLNELIASGNGQNISTAVYTPSVRISETNLRYDPFTGFASSAATDLHAVLSTSAATPIIEGVTNSGVIEDVVASGQRDLGRVEGWQIRATNPVFVPTTFNFANSIGSIVSRSLINGLAIVTGRFKKFELNTDSFNTRITIAGPIDKVRVRGNFSNSSSINAVGPNGKIKDIDVTGNFDGAISATGSVDKINIGQNFTGTIFISGRGKQALRTFKLGGSLDGSLEIIGSVGTINAAQSFGNSGDSFVITGNLKKLLVGTNTSLNGASLGLNLTVTNNVDEITVTGSLDGTINVGGRLKKLRVIADDASPASIVNGAINVGGRIDSIDVRNRNVGASIAAAQDIKKVRFLNSSLLSGALISSTGEDIDDFKITNGSLLGSVNAAGRIKKLDVAGNLGDGTSFASVGAFTIGTLKIGGSILNGYTVSVPSKIGTLQIGGNVDAGATVSAGSISKKQISGVVNGTVTP